MTEDFEIESLSYLLGQMEPTRRAAFEAELERDPAAAAAFKECADAMARFACDSAPAEPMSATDQQAALTAILAATGGAKPQPVPAASKVIPWSRYAWPIAAALLLGLNLVQFKRPLQPTAGGGRDASGPSLTATSRPAGAGEQAAVVTPPAGAQSQVENTTLAATETNGTATMERGGGAKPEQARQFEELGRKYADLQRTHAALRADYDAAVRLLASHSVIDKTIGRLAAMELVDSASYARGERKGLLEIARGILTEPGVVVADTSTPPTTDTPGDGIGTALSPEVSRPVAPPYAWAVYDEKENRGYLNLYNLPEVQAGQSLQLWVKPVDALAYQRVGEVPNQMRDGTGSLYYTLPEGAAPPAEILITQESKDAAPVEPTGPVVLRGP
ncbi:anti-sigma factor [Opitutus terrae]|uniref:Anti-sigma-K factor RskA n=1 Tax=Opitutus terrae (strain DSM 11246 / JCM 15787 / PB90-1) TaxID=452637 RepID=B1ZSY7_OPITP|nr:anti-sigma factor [Opitutus terrae]ACB75776.1 hypothetical protein Oter_2494 [Opitutus terrae PB90-1]